MFQEEFNSIITDHANIMDIPVADVKGISERYPYCQVAQVLYAKKLREMQAPSFEQQLKKAAVAIYDRNVLYQFIEKVITPVAIPAGMDETDSSETAVQEQEIPETPILEKATNISQEIHNEPVMEIVDTVESVEVLQDIQEQPFEEPVQEQALEIPVLNTDIEPEPEKTEEVHSTVEPVLEAILDSIPEMEPVTQEVTDEAQVVLEDEMLLEEETRKTDELVENLINETEGEIYFEAEEQMEMMDDEPIFEMPGYDIETELGTLAEEEKIKVNILKPIEEQVNDTVFEDSFVGWLNRLGSPSKGKLVEMKAANMPVRKYLQASPIAGVPLEEARQEKVIDEIVAGELARKSLQADEHLVTETYARILTMQGKYQKAVDMYMKLSLLKPQKSDYFAALIDQIKKRIK